MKLQSGRRYLVKFHRYDPLTEIQVLEISPEGRVKARNLETGLSFWLDLSQLDKLKVIEELPIELKSYGLVTE